MIAFIAWGCASLGKMFLPAQVGDTLRIEADQPVATWTDAKLRDDPDRFRFAVLADRAIDHRPGVFVEAIEELNLLQPAFVISVGDQIEGYTKKEKRLEAQWRELLGVVSELDAPYFAAPGNHDVSNPFMVQAWQKRFGASYYAFHYKGVLFLLLNSELFKSTPTANAEQQAAQMAFVEKILEANTEARWTFVILHRPFWQTVRPPDDWKKIEAWLALREHTIFAGHHHRYDLDQTTGWDRISLATTGGRSELRGIDYGEFDHFIWVTMTEHGPVIGNVLLGGVKGKAIPAR